MKSGHRLKARQNVSRPVKKRRSDNYTGGSHWLPFVVYGGPFLASVRDRIACDGGVNKVDFVVRVHRYVVRAHFGAQDLYGI